MPVLGAWLDSFSSFIVDCLASDGYNCWCLWLRVCTFCCKPTPFTSVGTLDIRLKNLDCSLFCMQWFMVVGVVFPLLTPALAAMIEHFKPGATLLLGDIVLWATGCSYLSSLVCGLFGIDCISLGSWWLYFAGFSAIKRWSYKFCSIISKEI